MAAASTGGGDGGGGGGLRVKGQGIGSGVRFRAGVGGRQLGADPGAEGTNPGGSILPFRRPEESDGFGQGEERESTAGGQGFVGAVRPKSEDLQGGTVVAPDFGETQAGVDGESIEDCS